MSWRDRILATVAAVVVGVAGPAAGVSAPTSIGSASTASSTATSTPPVVTKVLVFVVENHSLAQMKSSMPFVYGLAQKYAYASNYVAITHPSLPNYLAMAGGSTFGITDDKNPSAHPLRGPSVFDQARRNHRTAKIYADAMTTNCRLTNSGTYAVRHNPWTYFAAQRTNCRTYDVPVGALARDAAAGRLPNAGMVIPDLNHDAHDASLATADAWIKKQIQTVQAGYDWRSGRLAIVVTADEDNRLSGNKVLTVVASRYQPHRVVTRSLNHYSLTRLYGDVLGTVYLRKAATAASMKAGFAIRTRARP